MIMNDRQIRETVDKEGMLDPFVPNQVKEVFRREGHGTDENDRTRG
jgi:hypothetical protein